MPRPNLASGPAQPAHSNAASPAAPSKKSVLRIKLVTVPKLTANRPFVKGFSEILWGRPARLRRDGNLSSQRRQMPCADIERRGLVPRLGARERRIINPRLLQLPPQFRGFMQTLP